MKSCRSAKVNTHVNTTVDATSDDDDKACHWFGYGYGGEVVEHTSSLDLVR